MNEKGLTLLETMVALVIVGVVAVGFLEVFGASARTVNVLEVWSAAVGRAEEVMERVKIDPGGAWAGTRETLADGTTRSIEVREWRAGMQMVSVTVRSPDGRRLVVSRLLDIP